MENLGHLQDLPYAATNANIPQPLACQVKMESLKIPQNKFILGSRRNTGYILPCLVALAGCLNINPIRNIMNNKTARKGFTLVEIMIVVVIIGLLAAMAIPAFAKVRQQSRLKAVTNNLRQIANAAQSYMMEKSATQAAYTDLVGTGTDFYLHGVTPVVDEVYTGITVQNGASQLTLSSTSLGSITYTM
jgi:type IV pilus assembly protein PilA